MKTVIAPREAEALGTRIGRFDNPDKADADELNRAQFAEAMDVIELALAGNMSERFQSADDLAMAIENAFASGGRKQDQAKLALPLIAGLVGNDQFAARIPECFDQLDGVLDAFTLNHPRGLQNKDVIRSQVDFAAKIMGFLPCDGRRIFKVKNIGNNNRG